MARIIVEAVSSEVILVDAYWELELFVSVSRADDGTPITGLQKHNFRICTTPGLGSYLDLTLQVNSEARWETFDVQPAGCYSLVVKRTKEKDSQPTKWFEGQFYMFGIQVQIHNPEAGEPHAGVIDRGQTVVRVKSLGH